MGEVADLSPALLGLGLVAAAGVGALFLARPIACLAAFGIFVLVKDWLVRAVGPEADLPVRLLHEGFLLFSFTLVVGRDLLRGRFHKPTPLDLPLVAFVAVALLASLERGVPFRLWGAQLILLLKPFLLVYLLHRLDLGEEGATRFLRIFGWASALLGVLGLVEVVRPADFRSLIHNPLPPDFRFGLPSVQSLMADPGAFGWFMAYAGLFALSLAVAQGGGRRAALAAGFFVASFLSTRRKPLGGMAAGLLAGISAIRGGRKLQTAALVGFLALVGVVAARPALEELWSDTLRDYVYREVPYRVARNAMYETGARIAVDEFPLGTGLGRFGSWMSTVEYSPVYDAYGLSDIEGLSRNNPGFVTDAFWPMILGETGFLGLAAYLWLLVACLRFALRAVRSETSPPRMALALGAFAALVDALVESIASPIFTGAPACYFVFGPLGFLLNPPEGGGRAPALQDRPRRA